MAVIVALSDKDIGITGRAAAAAAADERMYRNYTADVSGRSEGAVAGQRSIKAPAHALASVQPD